MSKLDLELLERIASHESPEARTFIDNGQLLGLIQRLREAEYDRDVIAPANADDVQALHDANGRLQQRIATLEVAVNEMIAGETHAYSKDPAYWTAIPKVAYAAVLDAMIELGEKTT